MFTLVVAISENNVIGHNNQLIWHLPADLLFFKKITMGHPIVMGRKTFESIGRPLPGRKNVVITRDENFSKEGVEVFHTIDQVISAFGDIEEVMIIGGAEIYRQFLPYCKRMFITRVHHTFNGDTFFPSIDHSLWKCIADEYHAKDEKNPYDYSFQCYERV